MRCFAYRCRSRAWAACEPCQAGNRAALSGACLVPRSSLHLYAKQRSRVLCPLFLYLRRDVSMYRALYRKWRPQRFADVVGQTAIVTALQNQIAAGRIGHAYLFTGTRGIHPSGTAWLPNVLHCKNCSMVGASVSETQLISSIKRIPSFLPPSSILR